MTPDSFFQPLLGQSLLIPGQKEIFRGQCVQSVGLWVQALGLSFPAYLYAYLYYFKGIPGYTQIPAGKPIKTGDIVIWSPDLPGTLGAGHIDVAAQDGVIQDFWGYDSNWVIPLRLSKTHHTAFSNYILGYLRKESPMTPQDMAAMKFVATRQNSVTPAEVEKYQSNLPEYIQYLQRVQIEHNIAPQPIPAPVSIDTVNINGKPYVPQ